MYADTEEDFNGVWDRLQTEFSDQQRCLDYLRSTYLPYRHQWAQCYISEYENFGVRTNSPTETAHKDLKSYVVSGNTDLISLAKAINEMLSNKEMTYVNLCAAMEMRSRRDYLQQGWLNVVAKQVGYRASS